MTREDRIFSMRKACLAYAEKVDNDAEAARVFGISRTTFYTWRRRAAAEGIDALRPRERRRPQQPNQTPLWQEQIVVAEAVSRPTLGPGRLVGPVGQRGVELSASGIYNVLRRNRLNTAEQRLSALAQITLVADGRAVQRDLEEPSGFCHWAACPGDLVALDGFYVGKLKGVGKVWQLTAVDTATRWAIVKLIVGNTTAAAAAAFVDLVVERLAQHGVQVGRVLTDRGTEFTGTDFTGRLDHHNIGQVLIPAGSPDHNAVCERFQGTALQEFYRPHFHRQFVTQISLLQDRLRDWVHRYNTVRPNQGAYMDGRRPIDVLEARLEQFGQAA